MRVITVSNQKGGSTKTATTLGLCSAAGALGLRVLAIDLDPQANLSTGMGVDPQECAVTVNEVLAETAANANEGIVATSWRNLDLMTGSPSLANRESDAAMDIQFRLRNALATLDLSRWDLILIDTPPFVGKLMANAMAASQTVLVATDASADGARGVANIVDTVDRARRSFNQDLRIEKIVIGRRELNGEQEFREGELRSIYGDLVARTVIPKRAAVADAHGLATPINELKGKGAFSVATAYKDLIGELGITSASNLVERA